MRITYSLAFMFLLALLFAAGLRPVSAAPPTTTIEQPFNVTATSATFRGSVNPNGKSTLVDFISHVTPDTPGYFSSTPAQSIGSGSSGVVVEYTITGLTPATTYGVRIRATNSDGTTVGSVWPFTTKPATPPPPSTPFDFTIMLSPSTLTVRVGEIARFQIILSYSNPSYSGTTITIQAVTGLGPGMTYQVIPSPASLSIVTSQSTPAGSYSIAITGSAMGVVRQGNAILVVQAAEQSFDFSISASPTQQTAAPGASVTSTVTVNLVSGTSQNVVLTVSGLPTGISASLNPTSGTPTFNSILTLSIASSVTSGQYTVTVTGTAGAKTQTATIMLTVGKTPDFRIDVNPSSQASTQGQTTSFSVNIVGLDGFNSQVSLSVTGLPTGTSGVFSIPSSKPPYSSTLTITIPSNSPTGSFTVTITGFGEGITRVANIVLSINPSQTLFPSGILETLQQNTMIIIIVLVLLIVLFGALAMRNRGRQTITKQGGTSRIFCGKCGAENLASNDFCAKCGQELKRN